MKRSNKMWQKQNRKWGEKKQDLHGELNQLCSSNSRKGGEGQSENIHAYTVYKLLAQLSNYYILNSIKS